MVLIESFKHKKQAWHVDTPYPHVYVNILYLDEGQYMTQTLRPRKDSTSSSREGHPQSTLAGAFSYGGKEAVTQMEGIPGSKVSVS